MRPSVCVNGGVKGAVLVNATEISSPFGRIPAKRVTFWSNSGDSKTSVGTGVATTLLFGGIGLLGFLAKNHQYNFTVNGFDATGNNVSMQFEFKNDRPAKLLMQEMAAVTGLGMGQTRTAEDIIVAEQNAVSGPGVMQSQSPGRLSPSLTSASLPVAAAADTRHCWSTYLNRNPAMKNGPNPIQLKRRKIKNGLIIADQIAASQEADSQQRQIKV